MTGWLIAFGVFAGIAAIRILIGTLWVTRREKNYFLKKQIEQSFDVDELLDWKLRIKDKELLKEIDKQLDKLETK